MNGFGEPRLHSARPGGAGHDIDVLELWPIDPYFGAMATYWFNLKTDEGIIIDTDGTNLPDDRSARKHAEIVARELMAHREPRTRSWRLDVRDTYGLPCFDLLFARVDDTLGHLRPDLRSSLEGLCASSASFAEAIHAIKLTLFDIKATIARSEGVLYLAAVNGAAVTGGWKPRRVLARMREPD